MCDYMVLKMVKYMVVYMVYIDHMYYWGIWVIVWEEIWSIKWQYIWSLMHRINTVTYMGYYMGYYMGMHEYGQFHGTIYGHWLQIAWWWDIWVNIWTQIWLLPWCYIIYVSIQFAMIDSTLISLSRIIDCIDLNITLRYVIHIRWYYNYNLFLLRRGPLVWQTILDK